MRKVSEKCLFNPVGSLDSYGKKPAKYISPMDFYGKGEMTSFGIEISKFPQDLKIIQEIPENFPGLSGLGVCLCFFSPFAIRVTFEISELGRFGANATNWKTSNGPSRRWGKNV